MLKTVEKEACEHGGSPLKKSLNRLVAVEDAAQQMQDAVDAQKKELAAQMEEKKKQFDSMLELKTEQKTEELEANMEHEKAAALEKLREETKKQLAGMQHKYDTESTTGFRMKFCSP